MPYLRTIAALCGLLVAVVMWGCSGADDEGQRAAAEQPSASSFQVASPNFTETRPRVRIPPKNTGYGDNLSPPLEWSGAPDGTNSFALIAEDVDHSTGVWVHWVLYNIPAGVSELSEGLSTSTPELPDGTTQGTNDDKQPGYSGACPPRRVIPYSSVPVQGEPAHRYYFRLYALDSDVDLAPGATKAELVSAMDGHILAQAETVGRYTVSLGLTGKEGAGFLKTSAGQDGDLTQTAGEPPAPGVEKIYNSLGDLITPTPAAGR